MRNLRMKEKLEAKKAIDVRTIGTVIAPGKFEIIEFQDDMDYCDGGEEQWIWSIGKELATGKIIASTASDLYRNPKYECLFLR